MSSNDISCHCGAPAPIRGDDDPWEGRLDGYCEDCALLRCDAYPDECRAEVLRRFREPPPPWAQDAMAKRLAQPPMQRAMESIKTQVIMELRRRWRVSTDEMVKAELLALDEWVAGLVTTVLQSPDVEVAL